MTHESLVNGDWRHVIGRLGGPASLESSARETTAFLRARAIENAVQVPLRTPLGEQKPAHPPRRQPKQGHRDALFTIGIGWRRATAKKASQTKTSPSNVAISGGAPARTWRT
jgi:hypothetical protein